MRSTNVRNFSVRLSDGTNQYHQKKRIPFAADGAWHEVVLRPEAVAGEGEPRARMHRVVDVYFRYLVDNRRYLMLVISVLASGSPHSANIRKSITPLVDWLRQEVEGAVPDEGLSSIEHLYVTVTGAVNQYFSHAQALEDVFRGPMMSEEALAERAAHLHWLVDTIFARIAADAK